VNQGEAILLGEESHDEEEPRTLLGKATATVGRDRDLDLLERVFDDCLAEGTAHAVLVTGSAGAGKTRLRHELLRRLRRHGVDLQVLLGRADSTQGGSPFAMLAPALRKMSEVKESDGLEVRRDKVRRMVADYIKSDQAVRIAAFLGELMGVRFADEESLVLAAARQEPRLMADQVLASWLDWLEAVTSVRPVLIVLENLHFGDLSSISLVDAALRAFERRPLMVLGLARPEIDQRFPNLFRQRELLSLHLGKLPRKACERLVDDVLGERIHAEKRAWLIDRSDGNAFYLEELIRAAAAGAPDTELPDTVLGMLQARLDALGDDGKRILRAASVFGESFREDGVRELLGGPRCKLAVGPWLATLVKQEMIFARAAPSQNEYAFRHALLRDAAYATLTEADRVLGHRLAGVWLERNAEIQPLILAEHFERGAEPARAATFYRAAAEKGLEANDLSLVLACVERGVRLGATGEVRGELAGLKAEAHQWRGELLESEREASEAMRWLQKGSAAWFRAAAVFAMASCRRGNGPGAIPVAEEMLALASAPPSTDGDRSDSLIAARAVSLALAAGDVMLVDHLPLAEKMLERIKSDIAEEGHDRTLGNVHAAEAMIAILKFSDPSSCLKHARAALEHFDRAGDTRSGSWQLVNVGYALNELGLYAEAEVALRDATAQADRMGISPIASSARQNLGMSLLFQGRLPAAEIALASATDAFRQQGDIRQQGTCHMYMARLLITAGRLKHAEAEARKAVELFAPFPALKTPALAAVACALVKQSEGDQALSIARSAIALLESTGSFEGESFVTLVHARALFDAGQRDEARVALDGAERRVIERARAIADPAHRQSFLENVPDNREVLELAAQWASSQSGSVLKDVLRRAQ
jgi:tetratricopeptide (TPR) repeat protein